MAAVRSRVIAGPGPVLHVLERPGDGPTVVALHGRVGCAQEWDEVAEALGLRVLALDLRGHGRSARAERYALADYVDDVVRACRALDAGPVVLAGHSLGGLVAMATPEGALDLRGLVVLDIGPELPASALDALRSSGALPSSFDSPADVVAQLRFSDPHADLDALERRVRHATTVRDGRVVWRHDPRAERLDGNPYSELWDAWRTGTVPALVLRGEHSPYLTADLADRMVAGRAGAGSIVVCHAGHDLLADAAPEVAVMLRTWLAAGPGSSG